MKDEEPLCWPRHRPTPPPQPGEHLWTLRRGAERRHAAVRDYRDLGAELLIYVNDEFASGQRYPDGALAALAGDAIRDAYEREGWTRR